MTIVEYPGEYSAVENTLGNILEKDLGECLGEGALCFEWSFTRTFPGNQDVGHFLEIKM